MSETNENETKDEGILIPIAKPLAGTKLSKTLFSLVKEGWTFPSFH